MKNFSYFYNHFITLTSISAFILLLLSLNGCKKNINTNSTAISEKTKEYLQSYTKEIQINIIGLNSAHSEMQDAINMLLSEFKLASQNRINFTHLTGDSTYTENISSKPFFAQVIHNTDTVTIGLEMQIEGFSTQQLIDASINELEYKFITAIQSLAEQKERHIAFIEGHNELSRVYTYDAEEALSRYYNVSRGQISNNVADLDIFDAIIIAGPKQQFSTIEKYIIDQYIMRGGRVLWLIDGAYFSVGELAENGYSASIKNDTNLDDMLFAYGVRINPDFIQDKQSVSFPEGSNIYLKSDYYTPLLNTSDDSPITKNIGYVKASFISSLDTVKSSFLSTKTFLLTSSKESCITQVPSPVSYDETIRNQYTYSFDQQHIPTAVALQGIFESSFANRVVPKEIIGTNTTLPRSKETRMIVVASSDIIRNDVQGYGDETQMIPMGYDIFNNKQYANREFIINAINWLTDDDNWMQLRMK